MPTTDPRRFRHRTAEVEAVQWTGSNAEQMRAFCSPFDFETIDPEDRAEDPDKTAAMRESVHGTWQGMAPGDWAVKIDGRFVVGPAADFAERYEPVPVSCAAPDQTALRDRVAEALGSLQGTAHHLPPGTRKQVEEALTAALAPLLSSSADWDALVAETDRLRREGVALHERAVELDAQVAALQQQAGPDTDRATVLRETADRFAGMPEVEAPNLRAGIVWAGSELRRLAAEAQQSDVGTEFVRQTDQPDEAALTSFEATLPSKTPPKVDSKPEPATVAPSARAGLRDKLAAALYERERPTRDPHWPDAFAADREVFEPMAEAVLAVLYREWPWLRAEAEDAAADQGGALIDEYLRHLRGQGPEPDLSGLSPVQREAVAGQFKIVRALADRDAGLPPLDRDPVARRLGLAAVAQPEAAAAATLARECTDHAAVILWCAERVRSVDDDPAVQDAADHLHGLSTRAQVDATPVTERAAIIRWCAQEIHSMGGNGAVERAAEYLDDLATEAEEEPAAECSAQHRSLDDGRLCIRAAQHRGDHIDERGFHWSDTVAVYPVADGTSRTGVRPQAVGARQPETETPSGRRETVEYFLQAQQDDGTWEDASSFMNALDWATERLAGKRAHYPDFTWRMAQRTTTVTVQPMPDCLACRHWRCNGDGPCGALLDAWQRCTCAGPAAASAGGSDAAGEETEDAPPKEPHPTEADLAHALAVVDRFHGRDTDGPGDVVHGCPPDGSGLTPCCGRTPFELPLGDRISSEAPITCPGPAVSGRPAADASGEETDRIVAYRLGVGLHCIGCTPSPRGDIWEPVTSDDLPDGGLCAGCGVDVLIPREVRRG